MEEKLYFKPADYGKGTKKAKVKPEKSPKPFLRLGIVLVIFIALIIVVLYFLRGKTTTTNEQIPTVKSTSLSCFSDSFVYPIFTYDGAKSRELSIKMIFSEDTLKSVALEYSLFYDSVELIREAKPTITPL